MNFERLTEYFPQLPLAMLLGLILSICIRRSPWASLIWVPTFVSYLIVSCLILTRIDGLGGPGPDAGWGGLEIMFFLLPVLAVCVIGLIACFFCRPKTNWNSRSLIPAISLCVAALAYFQWSNQSNVEVQLVDINGHPVNDVILKTNRGQSTSGFSKITLSFRRHQPLELKIYPTDDFSSLANWTINFNSVSGDSSKLRIRYTSSRLVGIEQSLNEIFTETVPFSRNIKLSLALHPKGSLDTDSTRNKIRAALNTIKKERGRDDLSYGYVCRNLVAVEFLSELIELARTDPAQEFRAIEGLKAIANTLSDLNDSCLELRKVLINGKARSPAEAHEKVKELCLWAGIPHNGDANDLELLTQVQEEIFMRSKLLVDYCLEGSSSKMKPPGILSELGQINRPLLPNFIQMLTANPPEDWPAALGWSSVFFKMRATRTELKSLIESQNPLLQAAARDALND